MHLISYIKTNSQFVIDIKVKSKNIEENIGKKVFVTLELKIS